LVATLKVKIFLLLLNPIGQHFHNEEFSNCSQCLFQ